MNKIELNEQQANLLIELLEAELKRASFSKTYSAIIKGIIEKLKTIVEF